MAPRWIIFIFAGWSYQAESFIRLAAIVLEMKKRNNFQGDMPN